MRNRSAVTERKSSVDEPRRGKEELEQRVVELTEELSALHDINDLFNLVMKHSTIIAFITEVTPLASRVVRVSDNFQQMLGLPDQDVVGKTMEEIFPPELAAKITADNSKIVAAGRELAMEEELHGRYYNTVKFPLFHGEKNLLAGYIIDITMRKQVEEALRRSEDRFRSTINASPVPMALNDEKGNITFLNPAFIRTFGYTPEDISTLEEWWLMAYPDRAYRWWIIRIWGERLDRTVRNGAPFESMEVTIRCKDGSDKIVQAHASPLVETLTGEHLVVLYDITEFKRIEIELNQARYAAEIASKTKSEFLANMSHEIRTPMNAIIGLGYLMSRTRLTPQQQEYLLNINAASNTLLNLIDDILDLSKIEAGKMELETTDFSLREALDRVAGVIGVRSTEKGLALLVSVAPEVNDRLIGDSHRLEQVLLNLLGNAVKFTEKGEIGLTVTVDRMRSEEQTVTLRFAVRDTGIGLSGEQIAGLFRPFTQADNSTTRRYGGTGLGLNISKRLVELMEGRIEAEGIPGQGCTFTFTATFGVGSLDTDARQHEPANEELYTFRGARALVVEDQPINQQILREILEQAGMTVRCVGNGQEGVTAALDDSRFSRLQTDDNSREEVATVPFEIIFMDLQMPVMDGYEATHQIRRQWSAADLPIIAMTAHAMVEERERCRRAGMNDHLAKPVDVDELHRCLVRWICPGLRSGEATEAGERRRESGLELPGNLPGLNVAEGIARLGGNVDLYRRLVINFARVRHGRAVEIRSALETHDLKQGHALAHTLAGLAGNLAAIGLYIASKSLAAACIRGDLEAAGYLLPELEARLAEVISAAALLEEQAPPVPSTEVTRECDPRTVASLLRELGALVTLNNLKALDLADQLMELLVGTRYAPQATGLAKSLDDLDFATASSEIEALIELISDASRETVGKEHE